MTVKTADLKQDLETVELSDEDADDFLERLDAFRVGLSDKEQALLALMVFEAAGEDPPAAKGEGDLSVPTDEETDAFLEKLDRFHDDLPGSQHLYVDQLLGATVFKHEAEVRGYQTRIGPWFRIKHWQREAFERACYRAGGDLVRYEWRGGGAHRWAACYDAY